MTGGIEPGAELPARRRWGQISNPQDFFGGLALVAIAAFALWASKDLPGMRGIAFGPRTAPWLFAGLLAGLGVAVTLQGVLSIGPGLGRFAVRGPVFVTASILTFAATIRPLGLVISSFVTLMVAAAATEDVRWRESVVMAVVLTAFCSVLFPYGLNLPMQLWPNWLIQLLPSLPSLRF